MNLEKWIYTIFKNIKVKLYFTAFTKKHDPVDSETSVIISLQIVAFINGNWTNPHDIISTFISILSSTKKNWAIV